MTAQEVIPADGHTPVPDEAVEPTCTEDGLTAGEHCGVCGEVLTAQEVIPADGHTPVPDEAVEPTCAEDGLTAGEHCGVCGEVLTAQEVIPADGHRYESDYDADCDACGAVRVVGFVGDVDGSGKVDSTDARMVLQYAVKKIDAAALNVQLSDVDGSGKVDSTDARLILQYAVKKIDTFPKVG